MNDIINEIKVERKTVKKLEQSGALIGIEFEFVVPDIKLQTNVKSSLDNDDDNTGEESDLVSDYTRDHAVKDIQSIIDFYQAAPPINRPQDLEQLSQDLKNSYNSWRQRQAVKLWQTYGPSILKNYIMRNSRMLAELKLTARLENITTDDEWAELLAARAQEMIRDTSDTAVKIIRNKFLNDARIQTRISESAWLKQQLIERTSDVLLKYDYLVWPYQQVQADGSKIQTLAKEWSSTIGRPVIASSGSKSLDRDEIVNNNTWGIIPDVTVQGSDRYKTECGLEFVSPPEKFGDLATMIDTMRDFALTHGYYTNISTGLHFNISTANYSPANLDYVKLIVLIGDEQILEQFGRATGRAVEYAASSLGDIKNRLGKESAIFRRQVLDSVQQGCIYAAGQLIRQRNIDKYYSVNIHPKYVEFRAPGGDYLNTDLPQYSTTRLVNLARRLALALTAACDPAAARALYAKKLHTIIQNISSATRDSSNNNYHHQQQQLLGSLEKRLINK